MKLYRIYRDFLFTNGSDVYASRDRLQFNMRAQHLIILDCAKRLST